jgi:hypothetical protein
MCLGSAGPLRPLIEHLRPLLSPQSSSRFAAVVPGFLIFSQWLIDWARAIVRAESLRNDAFAGERACVAKDDRAVAAEMLV